MATSFLKTSRSLQADSSTPALIAMLLGVLFLGVWLSWFFLARVSIYEFSDKARLEVQQAAHPITPLVSGKIMVNRLILGQQVNESEVLLELDSSTERLRLLEEQSRLQALPAQIASLHSEIAALEKAKSDDYQAALAATEAAKSRQKEVAAALSFAKDHEQRLSKLTATGRIPLIDGLRAQSEAQKLSSAQQALSSEVQRLVFDSQTRSHMNQAKIENLQGLLAKLTGDMATAKITISLLTAEIEKHKIRAAVSGRIGDVSAFQVGSYVAPGDKLGALVPSGGLRIVADFKPADVLGKIHPGQQGQMRLEGFPWSQYGSIKAKVSRVASEIRNNLLRVEFVPENSPTSRIDLQHGLPGTIEVLVEQTSPALLLLRSAGQFLSAGLARAQPYSTVGQPS